MKSRREFLLSGMPFSFKIVLTNFRDKLPRANVLDFSAQRILHVCLADLCALFRCPGFVRHTIQLDHGPTAELDLLKCSENSGKIYSATAEFSPAISATALIRGR